MSRYVLINCYSDNNKGDLGIILSTIDYLRRNDENAEITGISTYNYDDPAYETEHKLLKEVIPIYPSVFGELNIGKHKGIFSKLVRMFTDTCRLLLFMILPARVGVKILFNRNEKKAINEIISSDFVVSKGGSFICNEQSFRDKISLFRFLYIFVVSFKLNKKVIVLAQSLGPVYGRFSKLYVNYILKKTDKIVIRETVCKEQYPYLSYPQANEIAINDIAFYLEPHPIPTSFNTDSCTVNVGMTIKYVDSGSKEYKVMMKEAVEHILSNHPEIHITVFPHVTIDKDPKAALEIYEEIKDSYKNRMTVLTGNYTANELKFLYSKMHMFIGTRLHSTIFAMGECVPSICIAYHGTKAQGIMENMSSEKYTVVNYSSDELIAAFNLLYPELDNHRKILGSMLLKFKNLFDNKFDEIFEKSK